MKKIVIATGLIALFSLNACQKSESTAAATNEPAIAVESMQVGGLTTDNTFTGSGQVIAENSAMLSTRMMGYVEKVAVSVGQKVQQGQLLISLNAADLNAKKAQVEAQIMQARAAFDNADKDYNRFKALYEQQSASSKELDDMTARYQMAKAQLEAARHMLSEVNAQFAYAQIRAPFSGTVTRLHVKAGDMANPGAPLVSVEGQGALELVSRVGESEIARLKNGMELPVEINGQNLTAKVKEISASARYSGGQYEVRMTLPAKADILPGMYAKVFFPFEKGTNDSQNDLWVPNAALHTQGDLTGIYVITEDGKALLRWLRVGRSNGNETEVLSGLKAGERIITQAKGKIRNGSTITTK